MKVTLQDSFILRSVLVVCLLVPTRSSGRAQDGVDPGKSLFLSPLIEDGHIKKAQQLSRVRNLGLDITSYSGFLTVDKRYNSNMFFWFFPAQISPKNAPVVLWLPGGPGGSALFGLFVENGPFKVTKDLKLAPRDHTWAQPFSMIYFDNPVGSGFSFTDSDDGYTRNEIDVANGLYSAILQFFTLFPEYQHNDFYIAGESYAGKYIPAIAYKIHEERPKGVRMKGLAIGGGLIDPVTMLDYGDYLYQLGLLDELQTDYMKSQENLVRRYIQKKEWRKAALVVKDLILRKTSFFKNVTGTSNHFNYLQFVVPADQGYYKSYLNKTSVRKAIHVGNLPFNNGDKVNDFLLEDIMQSVKPWFETLMDNYKVLIYSGQLDIVVAYPLTAKFLQTVQWKGAEEFKKTERQIWKVAPTDGEVAGYVRQVGDFYQVLVRNAGHVVPYDQPLWAYDMIVRFVNGSSF